MVEVDKIFIPGARADDIGELIHDARVWSIVSRYRFIALFYGGNGINDFPKNGIIRKAQTPGELLWDINKVCNMLLPRRLFLICCPIRINGCDERIKELNNLLKNVPTEVEVIGLGNKLSSAAVVCEDQVHLSDLGVTLLRSIVKHKILKKI